MPMRTIRVGDLQIGDAVDLGALLERSGVVERADLDEVLPEATMGSLATVESIGNNRTIVFRCYQILVQLTLCGDTEIEAVRS